MIILKTSGSLWQYYRDKPCLDDNSVIADFPADNDNSASFKFKIKIAGRIANNGIKDVKTMVPLKYLSNFWRTLEMTLINCEIGLILTWSTNCLVIDAPADTKLYVPVVLLLDIYLIKYVFQIKWKI